MERQRFREVPNHEANFVAELQLWEHPEDRTEIIRRVTTEGRLQNLARRRLRPARFIEKRTQRKAPEHPLAQHSASIHADIEAARVLSVDDRSRGWIAAIREFSVAHELFDVFSVILLSTELLKAGEENSERLKLIYNIESNGSRGATLVKQAFSIRPPA